MSQHNQQHQNAASAAPAPTTATPASGTVVAQNQQAVTVVNEPETITLTSLSIFTRGEFKNITVGSVQGEFAVLTFLAYDANGKPHNMRLTMPKSAANGMIHELAQSDCEFSGRGLKLDIPAPLFSLTRKERDAIRAVNARRGINSSSPEKEIQVPVSELRQLCSEIREIMPAIYDEVAGRTTIQDQELNNGSSSAASSELEAVGA
jgi:acyl-CoA hydrolase